MRGNDELSAWGRESLERADAVYVGSAHIREVLEDVVGHVERSPRGSARASTSTSSGPRTATSRSPRCSTSSAAIRRTPATPNERRSGRRERRAARRVVRERPADRPLLREAAPQQGRPRAVRRAARARDVRAVIVGFGGLSRGAGASRAAGDALHRAARAPPPGAPDPAVRGDGRAVDLPRGVRDGRGGGCRRRLAAARRAPLRARRDRRGPRASRAFAFESGDAADLARKLRVLLELPEDERRTLAGAARRTVVEQWSWPSVAGAAAQLIRPSTAAVASFMRSSCGPLSSSHGLPVERT